MVKRTDECPLYGRRRIGSLWVLVLLVALATISFACGSQDESAQSLNAEADVGDVEKAAVDLLRTAAGSSVNGASTSDGGFAVFGVGEGDGKISRDGVVFDREGRPTVSFELPERLAIQSSASIGRVLFVVGKRCDDAPVMDDVGVEQCEPGDYESYRVDLDSGVVSDLTMPEGGVEQGSWRLLRLGDRLLVTGYPTYVLGSDGATPGLAWLLDGDRWSTVEHPPGLVCQSGDHVVTDVTDSSLLVTDPSSSANWTARGSVTPAVRVLDVETATWGVVSEGPELDVPAAIGASASCTNSHVTFSSVSFPKVEPGKPAEEELTVVSFEIEADRWTPAMSLGRRTDSSAPLSTPNSDRLLLMGDGAAGWRTLDPETGTVESLPEPLETNEYVVDASGNHAFVFDPNPVSPALRVVLLATS